MKTSIMLLKMLYQRLVVMSTHMVDVLPLLINVDGTPENKMPDDVFRPTQKVEESVEENKAGLLDKVKNIFS